jgi:CelD/BcsL family acetyltransferase involved in cellulose biosynthesis
VIAEHHTSDEIFITLADEWDGLLSPTRSTNFFMRADWQRIWWKYLHEGSLFVVTVRDDGGTLRGIGSWFIAGQDGERVIGVIGCEDVTDYLEIIAAPGFEEPVFDTLLDFLLSDAAPAWDSIELCNVPEDSPTKTLFPGLASARGLTVEEQVQDVCPVIDLPGSYEDYLSAIDKKQRHELRRKRRRTEGRRGRARSRIGDRRLPGLDGAQHTRQGHLSGNTRPPGILPRDGAIFVRSGDA